MNELFQELQREALDEDPEWEEDEPAKAIQNAPLAKIFGHALQPLLSEHYKFRGGGGGFVCLIGD